MPPMPHPMTADASHPVQKSFQGALWVMVAENMALPLGFLFFVYVGRKLGPQDYGIYALAATFILWVEWSITSVFDRATVKLMSEAADWKPIAATVLRFQGTISIVAALSIVLLSDSIAAVFHEPALARCLRLFAVDIPIFCISQAHRNILDGVAQFRKRASTTTARWLAKLFIAVVMIQLGFSIRGAILANIGASLTELALCRFWIRPPLLHRSGYPLRDLFFSHAIPLFLQALSIRLLAALDLFALKVLGGTAAQAGIYSAAQNLSLLVGLIGLSFSSILLSTLSRTLSTKDLDMSKKIMRNMMRITFWLLPFVAVLPWFARDAIVIILGERYAQAAPLLCVLSFSALGSIILSLNVTILIASGKTYTSAALCLPMLPAALAGHLFLIPMLGSLGASIVTASVFCAGAVCSLAVVYRLWKVFPPLKTFLRSAGISVIACASAAALSGAGIGIMPQLFIIFPGVAVLFFALGEFSGGDLSQFRLMLSLRRT